MRNLLLTLALGSSLAMAAQTSMFEPCRQTDLRLPSVPLVINDPYISIWTPYDKITDGMPQHWTGAEKTLLGLLRVDGTTYKFMGSEKTHIFKAIVPMADAGAWQAKVSYTAQGNANWTKTDFDESSWLTQEGAFGTPNEYPNIRTSWTALNSDIYIRRHFTLTQAEYDALQDEDVYILFSHDDVCHVYLNGKLVTQTGETWIQQEECQLTPRQRRTYLQVGDNVIGYHVHNTTGGANADIGLFKDMKKSSGEILTATQNGKAKVLATNTYYNLTCGPVDLDLVFTAPMALDDLDMVSTPVNYISYRVRSNDSKEHEVQLYVGMSPDFAVNTPNQATQSRYFPDSNNGFDYVRTGVSGQNPLGVASDLVCIDWGYLYLPDVNGSVTMGDQNEVEKEFVSKGTLYERVNSRINSTDQASMPAIAYYHDFGTTAADSSYMMIGYDEVYDVQYLGKKYKGYWARNGKTLEQAIAEYRDNYAANMAKAREWDARIYDDGLAAGNRKYAEVLSGCYRQVLGAHKLFQDKDGDVMYFSKENNSGGFINTVDVTYPAAPLLMAYNTALEKGALEGIMKYCYDNERWGFDFPPHDLGFYPIADNQTYAIRFPGNGGEFGGNMPIEEAGNMLTLTAMVTMLDGNAEFASKYWDLLTKWTNYLSDNGQDPENQLCTDDFAGHSAHNTNLSLKAIMGVAGYAIMAKMKGEEETATKYMNRAKEMARIWVETAKSADGTYYKRAFDNNNTWSLKYNLIWDKIWGSELFPSSVKDTELNYYVKNHMNTYGIPLDDREAYTKSDWLTWVASLSDTNEGFNEIGDYLWKYINETRTRWPVSDWYWTTSGEWRGFRARSVVGGHWMKVLADKYEAQREGETTAIDAVKTNGEHGDCQVTAYYNLAGEQVPSTQTGICIAKYSDGSARKIVK